MVHRKSQRFRRWFDEDGGFRLCASTDQDAYDFAPYVSSLTEIERLTGITFFPGVNAAEKTQLNEFSSQGLWAIDRQFFERPCGQGH